MTARQDPGPAARPPADTVTAFEDLLLAAGRTRIDRRRLWDLWNRADPAWAGTGAARPRLASALSTLADAGTITLPAPRGTLWDTAAIPLPARIAVPANREPARTILDPAAEPWTPAMSTWAPAWIKTARPPQRLRLAAAHANWWLLATAGTSPPPVAREERSLHVFGNEKRLAALAGTALFAPGRLTLAALNCQPPLGAFRIAKLRPEGRILVTENKSTFDSAWRAQKANPNPGYAAVVFGGGDSAPALIPDLLALPETLGITPAGFDYAGDVDIAGIEAADAFSSAVTAAGLPPAAMAAPLWDAVARAEPTGDDITADRSSTGRAIDTARRLRLPDSVITRLEEGVRVPQERVDRTALADTAWWHPAPG